MRPTIAGRKSPCHGRQSPRNDRQLSPVGPLQFDYSFNYLYMGAASSSCHSAHRPLDLSTSLYYFFFICVRLRDRLKRGDAHNGRQFIFVVVRNERATIACRHSQHISYIIYLYVARDVSILFFTY